MEKTTLRKYIHSFDFELLKAQKRVLIEMQTKFDTEQTSAEWLTLEGMFNLIESIQDIAVDQIGFDKEMVYNFTEDGEDSPKLSLDDCKNIVMGKKILE